MSDFLTNFAYPLLLAACLAVGGLFLQVNNLEIRLVSVEENDKMVVDVHSRQDRILYKLCLLVNDGNMAECHTP